MFFNSKLVYKIFFFNSLFGFFNYCKKNFFLLTMVMQDRNYCRKLMHSLFQMSLEVFLYNTALSAKLASLSSGGRQATMSHHYFPFRATYQLFSLPAAMSHHYFPFSATYQLFSLPAAMNHHYFPFRTTTFDSSGQNYFFKWYIQGL